VISSAVTFSSLTPYKTGISEHSAEITLVQRSYTAPP